jgi:signal transduction histidine kinase
VVENLLDNAVRYAPRRGEVRFRARAQGDALIMEVGNSGPEIPESEKARIFERYYRLEGRRQGARTNRGLGLYFCRLAAEAHAGTIEVTSTEGLPACFVLTLPGAIAAATEGEASETA